MNLFNFNVGNLQFWLTYELSGTVLFMLSFYYAASFYAMSALALLFLPVLIGTLWVENRYGWLIFFALFVGLPALSIYVIFDAGSWYYALRSFPIGLFLFYCFLLKITVGTWDEAEREIIPELKL